MYKGIPRWECLHFNFFPSIIWQTYLLSYRHFHVAVLLFNFFSTIFWENIVKFNVFHVKHGSVLYSHQMETPLSFRAACSLNHIPSWAWNFPVSYLTKSHLHNHEGAQWHDCRRRSPNNILPSYSYAYHRRCFSAPITHLHKPREALWHSGRWGTWMVSRQHISLLVSTSILTNEIPPNFWFFDIVQILSAWQPTFPCKTTPDNTSNLQACTSNMLKPFMGPYNCPECTTIEELC